MFVKFMCQGLTIINVDESVIKYTDHRKRGWVKKGVMNQTTTASRLEGVNIIAALSNKGQFYYTVNVGKTNSVTFGYFLAKLCDHLDADKENWRHDTVIILDNASYHRANTTMDLIHALRAPILFLGPHHFRMAPVEMVFNFVKSHDLNPLVSKLEKR